MRYYSVRNMGIQVRYVSYRIEEKITPQDHEYLLRYTSHPHTIATTYA